MYLVECCSEHGELDPPGTDKPRGGPVKIPKRQRATPAFKAGLGNAPVPSHHQGWGVVMYMKNANTWENMAGCEFEPYSFSTRQKREKGVCVLSISPRLTCNRPLWKGKMKPFLNL